MRSKIIILSAFASPLRSGAEACAEEVSAALQDTYACTIVTARMRRTLPKYDTLQGVPVVRIGFGYSFDKWLFPFLAPFVVRKYQPDIVHAVLETFAGLALHLCAYVYPTAKRMLTLQTTNTHFLRRTIVRSPHVVTAISTALVHITLQYRSDVIHHIPNGVHVAAVPLAQKISGRVLFVGRLEPMKGIDVLLHAFAACNMKQATLRIIGDGSQRKKLEALAQSIGIADRVTFAGFVPVPDVYHEFAVAEIFCGLSRSEALGNVFIEAQAAGCAVVGTNVGGIPDIVSDGETGILVSVDDVEAASQALDQLLSNADLRQKFAKNGMSNAQSYDWSIIAKRYANVYTELLQSAK